MNESVKIKKRYAISIFISFIIIFSVIINLVMINSEHKNKSYIAKKWNNGY